MDFGELIPIAGILGGTVMFVSALRFVKERSALQAAAQESTGESEALATENATLRHTVGKLEERLAVLERIATDPAERTAREIESLR
jgi:hypothetical protein